MRQELSRISETLQFDEMLTRLAEVEGHKQAEIAKSTLTNLINRADDDVKQCINQVASSIGEQVNKNDSCVFSDQIRKSMHFTVTIKIDSLRC